MKTIINEVWPEGYPIHNEKNNPMYQLSEHTTLQTQKPLSYDQLNETIIFGVTLRSYTSQHQNFETLEACRTYNDNIVETQKAELAKQPKLNYLNYSRCQHNLTDIECHDNNTHKDYKFSGPNETVIFCARLNRTDVSPKTRFYKGAHTDITHNINPKLLHELSLLDVFSVDCIKEMNDSIMNVILPADIINPLYIDTFSNGFTINLNSITSFITEAFHTIDETNIQYLRGELNQQQRTYRLFFKVLI